MSTNRKRAPKRKVLKSPAKSTNQQIGERIRAERKRQGLTQRELAHAAGYQGKTCCGFICHLEKGDRETPTVTTLTRIAAALNVPLASLIP